MITEDQRRRLERERNSFEKFCQLQSEKVEKIREALITETDPLRKFQYEQVLQEEECMLKELGDIAVANSIRTICAMRWTPFSNKLCPNFYGDSYKLSEIENQLQPAPLPTNSEPKKIR